MTGPIPEPGSRAFEPSRPSGAASSSAPAGVPAFANPRSEALALRFGGNAPVRTPEEQARIKAEAQRKRDEKDAARRQKEALRKQKERDEDERKERAKAEREAKRKKK